MEGGVEEVGGESPVWVRRQGAPQPVHAGAVTVKETVETSFIMANVTVGKSPTSQLPPILE